MNDTIAAVASGMTASGIGIIRISGPEAFSLLKKIFRPRTAGDPEQYKTNTIHYGHIATGDPKDPSSPVLDECLVMVMRAPRTYTTEDTVEIDCHGGPFVMRRILELVIAGGARLAEPGEFTKRAFLGGRIDLTRAEAVMDIIRAGSDDALKSSLSQLSGSIQKEIRALRETILDEISYIEAALDDPEHYELENYGEILLHRMEPVRQRLEYLKKTYEEGRLVRDGIMTVILGKPNAGKSSLLNALTGEDRAIVTEIEGTTRDVLEEQVRIGGIMLRILDTAGIREAKDRIEQIGIERTRTRADEADLLLAVFDSSRRPDENDMEILKMIRGRHAILLLNKTDLEPVLTAEELKAMASEKRHSMLGNESAEESFHVVSISARERTGMEELESEIRRMFFEGHVRWNEEAMLTNSRHLYKVEEALSALSQVERSIADGMPEDFFSIDLMEAYTSLGDIIGEEVSDDLVDNIFAKFCMGK